MFHSLGTAYKGSDYTLTIAVVYWPNIWFWCWNSPWR